MSFAGPVEAIRRSLSSFLYLPPLAKPSISGLWDKLLIEYAQINSLNERPKFSMGSNALMNISVTYAPIKSMGKVIADIAIPSSAPSQTIRASLTTASTILTSEDTVLNLFPFIKLIEPSQLRLSEDSYELIIEVDTLSLFRSSFNGLPTLSFNSLASQLNGSLVKSMSLSGSIETISASLKLVCYMPLPNWNGRSSVKVSLSVLNKSCPNQNSNNLEPDACTGQVLSNQSALLWVTPVDDPPSIHLSTSIVWGKYFKHIFSIII